MDSTMKEVVTSSTGIIKNILSLNYTFEDVVKEYLNNVLSKNEGNPEYEIEIYQKIKIKYLKGVAYFDFIEKGSGNPLGFETLPDLKKAYRIADSERSETNNMGYVIYSPIAYLKDLTSVNLFIQNTQKGSFYSISFYNGDTNDPQIFTHQGVLEELLGISKELQYDIDLIIEKGGTRNIWFFINKTNKLDFSEPSIHYLLPIIMDCFKCSFNAEYITDKLIFKIIGKNYFDYLNKQIDCPIKIKYNDEVVEEIDVLESIISSTKKSITFDLAATHDEFYIKNLDDDSDKWGPMLKTSAGLSKSNKKKINVLECQTAKLTICDINFKMVVDEKKKGLKNTDKKIWVKVGKTYIFKVDFPGWIATNSVRAVIHFDNVKDNNFDNFITPNANKSNSTLARDLVDRISNLVKFVDHTKFTMKPPPKIKKETKEEKRLKIWEKCAGDKLYAICKECKKEKIDAIRFKIKEVEINSSITKGVTRETICCEQCYKS